MIETRNPFAGPDYPSAKADRFFLAEIDVLWERNPSEATRIVREYRALGGNHVMTGPVRANGYKFHYPDTNWLGRPRQFAECLHWLRREGIAVSLVVMTDIDPWYSEHARQFDRAAIERDFTPFYAELQQYVSLPRVISQWEQWQDFDECGWLFDWMARTFPTSERLWHNPPDHLGPGPGGAASDHEAKCAQHAVDHGIGGWIYQGNPPGAYVRNSDGRTPLEQTCYDLFDLHRKLRNGHAGWPTKTRNGQPISLRFVEAPATDMYHHGATQALAREVATAVLAVEGITESWDGLR